MSSQSKSCGKKFKIVSLFRSKRATGVVFLIFVLLGFGIYGNSIHGSFVWDDIYWVRDNPALRPQVPLKNILAQDISASRFYGFYRPFQTLTYRWDYLNSKLNVEGYHETNIFLHIFVSFVLFLLLRGLRLNFFVSFLISLFFLIHPIQTETVAYISGRAESLVALCERNSACSAGGIP